MSSETPDKQHKMAWLTPNMITAIRILLIPFVLTALLTSVTYGTEIAFVIFVLAAFSDGLDGYLARKRNQVTRLGKLLDPLADKLLVTAVLVTLVQLDRIEAWIVVLFISREFAVTGLRGIAATQGHVIAAGMAGKVKTVLQIALIMALIPESTNELLVDVLLWSAVAATVISGAQYFWNGRHLLRSEPEFPSSRQ